MERIRLEDMEKYKQETEHLVSPFRDLFSVLVEAKLKPISEVTGVPIDHWPAFTRAFGGARPGEIVVITSETGTGKSTFAMNWLMGLAMKKAKILLISLENRIVDVAIALASMVCEKRFDAMVKEDMAFVGEVFGSLPGWFLDVSGPIPEAQLLAAIQWAGRNGVAMVVVDHLGYVRDPYDRNRSESSVIEERMQKIAHATKTAKTCVVLIAHPRSLDNKGVKRREIGLDEIRGSSGIKQEAAAVFGIHRELGGENITQLRFLKIRNGLFGHNGGSVLRFSFNPHSQRLTELSSGVEWT